MTAATSTPDLAIEAIHQLASEVDATHRLVRIAADLVDEILGRAGRIERRIDHLGRDPDGPIYGPTRMDRVLDLSRVGPMRTDLLYIADRICVDLDADPPSLGAGYSRMMLDELEEKAALKAELEAARLEKSGAVP